MHKHKMGDDLRVTSGDSECEESKSSETMDDVMQQRLDGIRHGRGARNVAARRIGRKKQTATLSRLRRRESKQRRKQPPIDLLQAERGREQKTRQSRRRRRSEKCSKKVARNLKDSELLPAFSFPALDTGRVWDHTKSIVVARRARSRMPWYPNDRLQRLSKSILAFMLGWLDCYDHVAFGSASRYCLAVSRLPHSWHVLRIPCRLQTSGDWKPRAYHTRSLDIEIFKSPFRIAAPVLLEWELGKLSTFPCTTRLQSLKLIGHTHRSLLFVFKYRQFPRLKYLDLCVMEVEIFNLLSYLPHLQTLKLDAVDLLETSFSNCVNLRLRSLTLTSVVYMDEHDLTLSQLALISTMPLTELNLQVYLQTPSKARDATILFGALEKLKLSLHAPQPSALQIFRAPVLRCFEDMNATSYPSQWADFTSFPLLHTLCVCGGRAMIKGLGELLHLRHLAIKLRVNDIGLLRVLNRLESLHIINFVSTSAELACALGQLVDARVCVTGLSILGLEPTWQNWMPLLDLHLPLRLLEICECILDKSTLGYASYMEKMSMEQLCALLPRECYITTHGCEHVDVWNLEEDEEAKL